MPNSGRRSEGFEREDWQRWGEALGVGEEDEPPRAGLLLVEEEGQLVRVVHTARARLDPSRVNAAASLAQLAVDHRAGWVVRMQSSDLTGLCREPWAVREDEDYVARLLQLWSALADLQAEGRLQSWPHALTSWPALVDLAPRGLAPLCPDEHVALAAIWRGTRLSTALAFRKKRGRIERIVGPRVLQAAMGLVSGDWTRDYRYLSQATERLLGPLGLGFFAQESAVRELSRQGDAAAWARAVATREVIVSPMSSGLAMPLGIDLGRSALRRARDFVGSRGWGGWIPHELGVLFDSDSRRPDLRDLLGLDPFQLLERATRAESDRFGDARAPFVGASG